jgi:hypothetical protein
LNQKGTQFRSHNDVNTGLNAKLNNQCSKIQKFDIEEQFKMFTYDMSQKNIVVQSDLTRFKSLFVNQQIGIVDEKSVIEARACLQAEVLGLFDHI